MEAILKQGLESLGLDTAAIPALTEYARRLLEKNKVMNLTAITEPRDAATLHLLDCAYLLTAADVRGKTVVDVGILADTTEGLECETLSCVHARAEEFAADHREQYDYAVSRAVAALPILSELALPLVKPGGAFLAMKSVESDAEIDSARSAIAQLGGKVEKILDYTVPCTEVRHRVVVIRKVKPTPRQFPRAFARIKKSPLK